MSSPDDAALVEEQIDQWRSYLRRRQAIHSVDVADAQSVAEPKPQFTLSRFKDRSEPTDEVVPTRVAGRRQGDGIWRERYLPGACWRA